MVKKYWKPITAIALSALLALGVTSSIAGRNGSGTYNLPAGNPFVSGTTISSTTMNATLADIATALTNSLSKDGQTAPTADLQMAGFKLTTVGNAAARDQYATAAQVQDGTPVYLGSVAGTNTITASASPPITAYAAGQVFTFLPANTSTGAATININSVGARNIFINGAALSGYELRKNVPITLMFDGTQFHVMAGAFGGDGVIGEVKAIAGPAAPTGWLLTYGQAVSRTTYADLFALIGTTYGVGDNSTTFNLPDLRGRAAFGKDDMGGAAASRITVGVSGLAGATLGAVGGDQLLQSHTHTGTTATESVAHTHTATVTDPGHSHSTASIAVAAQVLDGASGGTADFAAGSHLKINLGTIPANTTGITVANGTESALHTHTITTAATGTGSSQNVPPAIVLNFVIKY